MPRLGSRVRISFPAPEHCEPRCRRGFPFKPPPQAPNGRCTTRLGGRVVMQRPAKPCTPVRFRPQPPSLVSWVSGGLSCPNQTNRLGPISPNPSRLPTCAVPNALVRLRAFTGSDQGNLLIKWEYRAKNASVLALEAHFDAEKQGFKRRTCTAAVVHLGSPVRGFGIGPI